MASAHGGLAVNLHGPFEIVPGVPPRRHVRIYVPRRAPVHDRPVLFMFDGQNVFDDAPSFAGGWHAHRAVERLAKNVAPPVVIGLDHGYEHRIHELSPFRMQSRDGSLEGLLHWISSWLLPKLRREHGLSADPRKVVIGGSSMGGLAALYAALRLPDVFGGAIAMSPSLFLGQGGLFRWVDEHGAPRGAKIYLDAGAREAGGRLLASARTMAHALGSRGVTLDFREDPKGQHREKDWRRRLLPALRFHFGTSRRR